MSNALRALVLLACSWSVVYGARTGDPKTPLSGEATTVVFAAIVVPFVLAVIVAWRGHDR